MTSAVLSHDASRVYMAGKEGGVSCSDITSGKQLSYAPKLRSQGSAPRKNGGKGKGKGKVPVNELNGHSDEVLALALSGDGKYLASGGKDRRVGVWDVSDDNKTLDDNNRAGLVWVKGFGGHKDTISVCPITSMRFLLTKFTLRLFLSENTQIHYIQRPLTEQ